MLRAAAAPERFLARGFTRFVSLDGGAAGARARREAPDLGVMLPRDLTRFLAALAGRGRAGDFIARSSLPSFAALLSAAKKRGPAFARLTALLAGGIPFGESKGGAVYVYFVGARLQGMIATLTPALEVDLVCRGAAELAVICSFQMEDGSRPELAPFDDSSEELVVAAIEDAAALVEVLTGTDARVRSAADAIGHTQHRSVLGAMIEGFFCDAHVEVHAESSERLVREASELLLAALASPKTAALRDLARRRELVRRAAAKRPRLSLEKTRTLVGMVDVLPAAAESYTTFREREELLLALAELGDRRVVPDLLERAVAGDVNAVDMLAALGDRSVVAPLIAVLDGEPNGVRLHEAAIARTLAALGAREALPALRRLLAANPMNGWREGLERGFLVRELVGALGELEDADSAKELLAILESTSQEYRAIVPLAALALGRIRYAPALETLGRLLVSPKDPVTCETVWSVGEIALGHADLRERAVELLERLTNLDPAIEATRLVALAKARGGKPKVTPLRRAIDRALWEPAFRQEETSRRRGWAFRALEELAPIATGRLDAGSFFLGQEAIRYFVTRDDHRVRRSALSAFRAWRLDAPATTSYYAIVLSELEDHDGLDSLIEAVKDAKGVFRHNVATRLADIGEPRLLRPLAEAAAKLFIEPPTSTYEYDDAPPELVAFVRALAKFNRPEGNDVLIAGLQSENHQVRAVVAENAPDDPRFVPELQAMLGDPRSFLRSRAEKSLISLGAIPPPADPNTTEVAVVRPAGLRNGA
jgi:HEAT repeat protein